MRVVFAATVCDESIVGRGGEIDPHLGLRILRTFLNVCLRGAIANVKVTRTLAGQHHELGVCSHGGSDTLCSAEPSPPAFASSYEFAERQKGRVTRNQVEHQVHTLKSYSRKHTYMNNIGDSFEFSRVCTAMLTIKSKFVTAGMFRVFGEETAELLIVATSEPYKQKIPTERDKPKWSYK
ncbi:hypothetical protein Tco_0690392 [Tanacetum coccineum]